MTGTALRSPQLPPLASVANALRTITERLAHELASPRPAAPDWSDFEWRIARAVAAMHGISGLLAEKLPWSGPEGWLEFLHQQREHIARRQLRLRELLSGIAERCERQGIPVQALKGTALHLDGLYEDGQRPMADLDLLTCPRHSVAAAKVLESLGLRESHRTFKHRVFEARDATPPRGFGEHADNGVKVELHERICEPLPYRLTDISRLVSPPVAVPGLNPYPSRPALIAHLLLHAAGGMAYRTLRLIQLHDIVLLARRLTPRDWQQLLDWRPWWAWPPLALAESYYGATAPQAVMASARAYCPPILRRTCARQRLSDVSLSRLWLEAFPGIEWARTAGEAALFIVRRVVPSAEVRSDRKFALTTDPSLAHGDWGGLSQGRRILRAVRARTPRPWPLHNVREALAEPR
jgi:Uncharacterised nucleotidyltransferase